MHGAPLYPERLNARRDHCLCLDLAARRPDSDPISVFDALLRRQFFANFGEEFRLQFGEPGHPARHSSTHVVFGEPVGSYGVGIVRVGKSVVWIVRTVPVLHHRIRWRMRVEQIRDRRLHWLVVGG